MDDNEQLIKNFKANLETPQAGSPKGYVALETSDVYAFGVLLFQILSGKQHITTSIRRIVESYRFQKIIDSNLNGRFFEYHAAEMVKTALLCFHESSLERPSMEVIVQDLGNCSIYKAVIKSKGSINED